MDEQPPRLCVLIADQSHALDLISAIVTQAVCPVIADNASDEDSFIEKAARRGIFAHVKHGEQPDMERAIDIVLNRYAEFTRLHGAFRTGATIEQAKGILMERHGISPDEAFAASGPCAEHHVAQAVTISYPVFKPRVIDAD